MAASNLSAMNGPDPLGSPELSSQISAIAVLNEPVRRALYTYILHQAEPVGREQAAEGVGITRELAAFHLEKLLEEGLLDVEYRRISGRTGPGAGRPNKLYRPSRRQVQVTLPERRYDLAATLLAQAIDESGGESARAVDRVARRFGETIGAQARRHLGRRPSVKALLDKAAEVLRDQGFEPTVTNGEVRLRNCPFDTIAKDHSDLVCGMNLSLAEGLLAGLEAEGFDVRLDPQPGMCCLALASKRRVPRG
jgi:predicted ArsR family transcriptional regulator